MNISKLRELLPKKKSKEELDRHYENIELEKGDFLAMVIAAFIVFLPILAITIVIAYGLIWVFFSR